MWAESNGQTRRESGKSTGSGELAFRSSCSLQASGGSQSVQRSAVPAQFNDVTNRHWPSDVWTFTRSVCSGNRQFLMIVHTASLVRQSTSQELDRGK